MTSFDTFYATYPRHVGKTAALKAWEKVIKNGIDPIDIIAGAQRYANDPERRRASITFTAHPATWLNQGRWMDETPVEAAPVYLEDRFSDEPEGLTFAEWLKTRATPEEYRTVKRASLAAMLKGDR